MKKLKYILIIIALFFFSNSFALAENISFPAEKLTPIITELQIEQDQIAVFVKMVNKYIPKGTVVTEEKIEPIVDLIESFILDMGYNEKEYYVAAWVSEKGDFHLSIRIYLRSAKVYWQGDGVYKFKEEND